MHWKTLRTYTWDELYLGRVIPGTYNAFGGVTHGERLYTWVPVGRSYAPEKSYAMGRVIHLGAWWQELRIETSDALGTVKHWEELSIGKSYVPRRSYAVGGVRHLGARLEELCTWEKLHNGGVIHLSAQ